MTHHHEGHDGHKHAPDTQIDPALAQKIHDHTRDGRINCAITHKIAAECALSPAAVGQALDLLDVRINQCQLGLFGYSPQKRVVVPAQRVAPELQQAIETAAGPQGLACADAWKIAEQFRITRLAVVSACETLQVKICACQLGAF